MRAQGLPSATTATRTLMRGFIMIKEIVAASWPTGDRYTDGVSKDTLGRLYTVELQQGLAYCSRYFQSDAKLELERRREAGRPRSCPSS